MTMEIGNFLKDEAGTFAPLEVAHILPHSLMSISSEQTELVCATLTLHPSCS